MTEHDPFASPEQPAPPRASTTDFILAHNRLLKPEVVSNILSERKAAAKRPCVAPARKRARYERLMTWIGLTLLLGSGLYLRWNELGSIQHFDNDNGRDYLAVMEWGKNGHWPLLGPGRITGDFTIGPGWFYTVAPAIMLSGYDPAAGAATVGGIGIVAIFLIFWWVRRATGSLPAAFSAAAILCWGIGWVEFQRECWNPRPLFFALVACVVLIQEVRRRPLPCTALYAMLLMIIPQWHTSGLSLVVISLPFFVWNGWRGRTRWREASRRAKWGWGAAAGALFLALYLPPMIHELKGGGNLASYFRNTLPHGSDAAGRPWLARIVDAAVGLSADAAQRNFNVFSKLPPGTPGIHNHLNVHLAIAAAVLLALVWRVKGPWRARPELPGVFFLIALTFAYWGLRAAQDQGYYDYFGESWFAAPVLLAAWAAGTLLRTPRAGSLVRLRWPAAACGILLIIAGFGSALAQLPVSIGITEGRVWHFEHTLRKTRLIVRDILKDAGRRSFSVKLIEGDGATPSAHFHALLWRDGNRPANRDYTGYEVPRRQMGRVLYVVTRHAAAKSPLATEGLIDWINPPERVQDALIYKIYPENVPEEARALHFEFTGDVIRVSPVMKEIAAAVKVEEEEKEKEKDEERKEKKKL